MLGHWFDERVASQAERILIEGVASSDALLLAHVVMPNHFHLVLRAGERTLGWVMQPIMRRLALLINRSRNRRGPVFEGRYRAHACDDPDHLRRAIVYVHNNPLRKNLCVDASDYAWQSHRWYTGQMTSESYIGAAVGLKLFVNTATGSDTATKEYLKYFTWRLEKDRCDELSIPCAFREPEAAAGDAYFRERFNTRRPSSITARLDVRDAAILFLAKIEPAIELNDLRRPYIPRPRTAVRRELTYALLQRGYSVGKIATLFRVSGATISRCASQLRYAPMGQK